MRVRPAKIAFVGALSVGLLLPAGAPAAAGPMDGPMPNPDLARTVRVGVASRSVLPTVNGTTDYLRGPLPGPAEPYALGLLVPHWDQGRVAVGNGDDRSFWVHDDVRVRAMALADPHSSDTVVLVSADVYMIFKVDGDEIRAKVAARLRAGALGAGRLGTRPGTALRVLIAATHNHHGPDTAFDVNHDWYERMTDQAADAVVAALADLQPATLRVASGTHYFGAKDTTDPRVVDPRLNVLQAVRHDGRVLATVVQWNDHPETTLNWQPPVPAADCATLTRLGQACTAGGRYFTADYPGVLADRLRRAIGGETLYFNGALGVLVGPGGSSVWEVDAAHPLGNGVSAPPGAVGPGGERDYTAKNFRRTAIVGEQLAAKVLAVLRHAEPLADTRLAYREEPFYTRLSNTGFRYLLVSDPSGRPQGLGHNSPMLYTCPATGPKNETTCTPDFHAATTDPVLGAVRVGEHLRSVVGYLSVGSRVGMVMMPAEVAGELVVGLPAGFRTDPGRWYQEPAGTHAFGEALQTPGYIRNRVPEHYLFTVGLGNDELGYAPPISNYRIYCVADVLTGPPGTCAQLHAIGAIKFADAVSGTQCKRLAEEPAYGSALQASYGAAVRQAVEASCRYGQALGQANGHYEETNSAGWDLAGDLLDAVGRLTGNTDPRQVNPDFPGYYDGYPPPAD
jgi:hypothetical protein